MKLYTAIIACVISGCVVYMNATNDVPKSSVAVVSNSVENVSMNCKSLTRFDETQKSVIRRSIELGSTDGLGYVLAAIAIQESNAGMYVVNANTHAYGPYHVLLKTAMARTGNKQNSFSKNVIASKLITDIDYSAKLALAEIKYWQKVHGNDLRKVLMSYNGGWKAEQKSESRHYADVVSRTAKELKTCSV